MLLVDTVERVIMKDEELKLGIARSRPHAEWLHQLVTLDDLKKSALSKDLSSLRIEDGIADEGLKTPDDVRRQLTLFNYTLETLTLLLIPMFTTKYTSSFDAD